MLRSLCFALAMVDDCAMQLTLAHSTLPTIKESENAIVKESVSGLEYYTTSLNLLQGQIRSIKTTDDLMMGIIIGLASYDV